MQRQPVARQAGVTRQYKRLITFKPHEIFLDDDQARLVLKFIFLSADHALIDELPKSESLIVFAQGLLIEAIDASYAIGYVQALFESLSNLSSGLKKVIHDFTKKPAQHWFEHVTVRELQHVKIYECITHELARSFRVALWDFKTSSHLRKHQAAFIAYSVPSSGLTTCWS